MKIAVNVILIRTEKEQYKFEPRAALYYSVCNGLPKIQVHELGDRLYRTGSQEDIRDLFRHVVRAVGSEMGGISVAQEEDL